MNAETISTLNFMVHSLVIGAAAWLLVRFVIRDALRRCILANLAVLMCLYSPFNISMQDLFPPQKEVPVWTPIRETFKADWRISVTPARAPEINSKPEKRVWDVNEMVKVLRWLSWAVTGALLLRLVYQCVNVQMWAWRLRQPTSIEYDKLPDDLHPERVCVFEHEGTPCVVGWFIPVIAVPASAFEKLTPRQWRWLLRHEAEHLRMHDNVVVLLQNMVRAFLWWNPFAHGLIEEYARAREEACDAAAVGAEREHTAYADFLLAWAGELAPQQSCVMPIAYSRPAKRLKVRLVALMEARGVRKKLGALFVLGCLAFAIVAPLIAASFGIATAAAQAAEVLIDDRFQIAVQVAEVTAEAGKVLGEWDPGKLTWKRNAASSEVAISQAPPEIRHVYTFSGVMTDAQFQASTVAIKQKQGVALVSLPNETAKAGRSTVFAVPAEFGGKQISIRPKLEASGDKIRLSIQLPDLIPAQKHLMVTEVTLWDGQTLVLSGIPADKAGITRMIFITAKVIGPKGEPVNK